MKTDDLKELVRRLLALSQSSNEHESTLAMEKAQEILLKYHLDMSDIETKTETVEKEKVYSGLYREGWKKNLLVGVAKHYFGRCIHVEHSDKSWIIATPTNRLVIEEVYFWIKGQIEYLCNTSIEPIQLKALAYMRRERFSEDSWKQSYLAGMVATIKERLSKHDTELRQGIVTNSETKALIVKMDTDISTFVMSNWPHLGKYAQQTIRDHNGYSAGKMQGWSVDIGKPNMLRLGK
mgnify:CR=1 FL=1